ncbi:hypothetical protein FNN14_07875 [Cronobacter sakazakii]|nr:hypothetical protein FNN14_07875 [Cronobacter sakazakii]
MGAVGALRLPTLDDHGDKKTGGCRFFYGRGGCASLTHPGWPYRHVLSSVGALRLPSLQDDTIYACRAGKRSAPATSLSGRQPTAPLTPLSPY